MNASATANNLFATYWAQQNGSAPPVLRDWLCFTAEADASTVSLGAVGTPSSTPVLQTSGDGLTWTSYTIGSTITLAEQGDKVYFKGDNAVFSTSSNDFYRFAMTGQVSASGNVMSLVDSSCQQTTVSQYMFRALFADCTALTSAPDLPATSVERECYRGMFSGCTSLTEAPELPAMSLVNACYQNMFSGCTSLTSAPELPATSLGQSCYVSMFSGCTALVNPPTELPADSLTYQAYRSMFYGCSAMTHPPRILATKHGGTFACREMFRNCTSLVEAVVPPALKLGSNCYQYMYRGCSSLTTAPELPATQLATLCYDSMFMDCTGLVTGPSAISVESISSQACYDMFSGCTHLVNAPALPATTVGSSGYRRMFKNCSSLQGPVVIRATSLSTDSLNGMLEGTSSLHEIQVAFTDWGNPLVSTDWVKNTAATGKFICPSALDTTRSINQVPVGWTVETLDPLPVGFTRIGATYRYDSYIDTGLLTDSTDEWIITCRRTGTAQNYPIIGGGNTKTDSNMALWLNAQTNLVEFTFGDGGSNAYKVTTTAYNVSEFHTYRMKLSTGEAWLDGNYIGQSASLSSVPNPRKLVLYGCWRGNANFSSFEGALAEAVIVRDGVEVRHFVPCIRNSDKSTGLFDLCGSSSPSTGTPYYLRAQGGNASTPWISYGVTAEVDAVQDALDYGFKIATRWYPAAVDWGDGSTDTVDANQNKTVSHTYAEPGSYTVEIDAPYASDVLQLTGGTNFEYRDRLTGITSYKYGYVPDSLCRYASRLAFPVDVLRDVTYIGSHAFRSCSSLSWRTLPDNLSQVNDSACFGCTSLALGALPPGVLSIAQEAFRNCSGVCLGSLPSGVSSIGGAAFQDCTSLHLHELPSGLTYIDANVFHGCTGLKLTSLPSGVTGIGFYAFGGCSGITLKSLPSGLTTIGYEAFLECTGLKLTSLPSGMTSISTGTFSGCTGLEQMTLPNGITEIGRAAFGRCTNLVMISLPSNLISIGQDAFWNCAKLELSSLPTSVTSIDRDAFYNCSSITLSSLPSGLTSIGQGAFHRCSNISVSVIPSGVTSVGAQAFRECTSITEMTLSEGVEEVGNTAFVLTGLTSVSLPVSLTTIGWSAFYYCTRLRVVNVPTGSLLTTIGGEAFRSCVSLERFTIPELVTSIADSTFWFTDKLTYIRVKQNRGALTSTEPWGASRAMIVYNDSIVLSNREVYEILDGAGMVMTIPDAASGPNLDLGVVPTDSMTLHVRFRASTAGPAIIAGVRGASGLPPVLEIGSDAQDNCMFVSVNGTTTYARDGSDSLTLSPDSVHEVEMYVTTETKNGQTVYSVQFLDVSASKVYTGTDVPYAAMGTVQNTMYLCGLDAQESMAGSVSFADFTMQSDGQDIVMLKACRSASDSTVFGYVDEVGRSFHVIDTSTGTTVSIVQ